MRKYLLLAAIAITIAILAFFALLLYLCYLTDGWIALISGVIGIFISVYYGLKERYG